MVGHPHICFALKPYSSDWFTKEFNGWNRSCLTRMSPIEKNAEGFILNKIEILQKTTALNGWWDIFLSPLIGFIEFIVSLGTNE